MRVLRQNDTAKITDMSDADKLLRYRLLVDLTAKLVSLHEVDEVIKVLHDHIGTLFPAPLTLLALIQPDGYWNCLTLEGRNSSIYRTILSPQLNGLLEQVLDGKLTYSNDIAAYAQQQQLQLRTLTLAPLLNLPIPCSWLGVPLLLSDQPAGVLSLQSYQCGDFSDDDLELLQLLAVHLGIAIENAQLRQQLEYEARTDALTQLGNRHSFLHYGEKAMNRGIPLCVAVLDVQGFKRVNDDFGHSIGDAVLTLIGELLGQHAALDGKAFRLGGDEFALLLPEVFGTAYLRLAALVQAFAQTTWPVAAPIKLNIGLAELKVGQSFADLVREADHAMYSAKRRALELAPLSVPL